MFYLWFPVLAYMSAIFLGSSLEDPPVPSSVPDVDLHAAAYFGLMLVVVRAVAGGTWSKVTVVTVTVAFLITVAYGASDEWHQRFVAGRHAELRDLRADAIGAFAAGVLVEAWGIIRRL